jgi:hypothetical protein
VGAIDPDAAGPGPAFVFLFLAMPGFVKGADPCRCLAEVTEIDFLDFADPVQQLAAKICGVVGIRGDQADTGDNDSAIEGSMHELDLDVEKIDRNKMVSSFEQAVVALLNPLYSIMNRETVEQQNEP